jgi:hypothetical protein
LTHIPHIRIDPEGVAGDDLVLDEAGASGPARYVIQQVNGLRIFLARIIGVGTRRRMDEAMEKAIGSQGWAAALVDGHLQFDSNRATPEIYQGILTTAINFAIDIAGQKWTYLELEAGEARVNPEDLAEAEDMGLREFLHRQ